MFAVDTLMVDSLDRSGVGGLMREGGVSNFLSN